ncbi:toxin glutamine deamidase domain-containing protein [Micromonospora sp. NPDC049366]|uniref:toxin glutamine deamidase domain-containing protein n=1 Tax=Micromonospora sp. NPDC049366 TaxID=3364271 RepID=UPI0037AAFDE5
MSLLPSPVPHPLDYSPWQLPDWVYEALDWVIGVEWPDGNERAVWDLADQWYAVATALVGPQTDAHAAADETRAAYGGVGAVAEAFDAAWRALAEGDEAPLPVLLTVSTDLGRLVEECGCDLEAAKIEVWIELGILVVELLSLAVATALTAGAASPAAGAAMTASRLIVQQIFKRLTAQLARKSLRHGLREAGERAAKQVVEGGVRGLARRSALGGLAEAGEEAGVSLATQAYQNTTGRRQGLDLTDLGTSAVGGLAGGAVAPLAGLGRHATGRAARVGEHLGREMAGETIAENAASLATGQGLTSLEDAARAAVSGATGSATTQADTALRARLDGRLSTLEASGLVGPPLAPPFGAGLPPLSETPLGPAESISLVGSGAAGSAAEGVSSAGAVLAAAAAQPAAASVVESAAAPLPGPVAAGVAVPPGPLAAGSVAPPGPDLVGLPTAPLAGVAPPAPVADVSAAADGRSPGVPAAPQSPVLGPPPSGLSVAGSAQMSGPTAPIASARPVVPPVTWSAHAPTPTVGPLSPPSVGPPQPVAPVASPPPRASAATAPVTSPSADAPVAPDRPIPPVGPERAVPPVGPERAVPPVPPERPVPPVPPEQGPRRPTTPANEPPYSAARGPDGLRPRTPEWYAAVWAADRDAFERRRYRGHFEHQRRRHDEIRRREEASDLRMFADRSKDEARWLHSKGRVLASAGRHAEADRLFQESLERERRHHEQRDRAQAILAGAATSDMTVSDFDFSHVNDDVGDLARGAVETGDRSALTDDDHPPPIDRSRRYGKPGGLRPPLALHQTDVERRVPREPDGRVARTPDPRRGDWFRLMNDGGPAADPTRGINCLDCTLSLLDTWMHGRPRVAAPRTFDAYAAGDINRPLGGEWSGPRRIEEVTGGRFQRLCEPTARSTPPERRHAVDRGYRNLHDQLLLGGHGTFAFVINTWEGGGSHVSVALNQNGTVLYLDPQTGRIAPRPLYRHSGAPHRYNAVDLDILVLAPDGRPMPMAGLRRGQFSALPDLPEYPPALHHEGYGDPYINRFHLIDGPGLPVADNSPAGAVSENEPSPPDPLDAEAERLPSRPTASRVPVASILERGAGLKQVFSTGVTPPELAAELTPAQIRRLVPQLDDAAANDVAMVLADEQVQEMLRRLQREPASDVGVQGETLVTQLMHRPDLARLMLASPVLMRSLTARPLTLRNLATHQEAIDALTDVLDDIAGRGAEVVAAEGVPDPKPTPLTHEQRQISRRMSVGKNIVAQPGFDWRRRGDPSYLKRYLDDLYGQAAAAQAELNRLAMTLVSVDGERLGEPGWRTEPKSRQRVLDKLSRYRGDASRLIDLAAAKIEFSSLDDLYTALVRIGDEPSVTVVRFEDRFVDPQDSGYRDVQMILRMRGGHLAEFRLHLACLDEIAVWEHALFEVRRDLDSLARADGREMTSPERAIADGILRREQDLFWNALLATYEESP